MKHMTVLTVVAVPDAVAEKSNDDLIVDVANLFAPGWPMGGDARLGVQPTFVSVALGVTPEASAAGAEVEPASARDAGVAVDRAAIKRKLLSAYAEVGPPPEGDWHSFYVEIEGTYQILLGELGHTGASIVRNCDGDDDWIDGLSVLLPDGSETDIPDPLGDGDEVSGDATTE